MIFAGIKGDGRNSRKILAHLISFLPLSTQCRRRLSLRRCSHGATASLSRSGRSAAAAALAPRAHMARPAGVAHPVVLGGVRASLQSMAHLAVFRRGRSCRGGSAGFGALTGGHGAGLLLRWPVLRHSHGAFPSPPPLCACVAGLFFLFPLPLRELLSPARPAHGRPSCRIFFVARRGGSRPHDFLCARHRGSF